MIDQANYVTALLEGHTVVDRPDEIQEVLNAIKVYEPVTSFRPFSTKDLLKALEGYLSALQVPQNGESQAVAERARADSGEGSLVVGVFPRLRASFSSLRPDARHAPSSPVGSSAVPLRRNCQCLEKCSLAGNRSAIVHE